jgi:hypothetical protein
MVRKELGPDASVLHTREVGGVLANWLGGPQLEVIASNRIAAPSRLSHGSESPSETSTTPKAPAKPSAAELHNYREEILADLLAGGDDEPSLVAQLAASDS